MVRKSTFLFVFPHFFDVFLGEHIVLNVLSFPSIINEQRKNDNE